MFRSSFTPYTCLTKRVSWQYRCRAAAVDNFAQLVSPVTWCYATHVCVLNFLYQLLPAYLPIAFALFFTYSELVIDLNFFLDAHRSPGTYKVEPVPITVMSEPQANTLLSLVRWHFYPLLCPLRQQLPGKSLWRILVSVTARCIIYPFSSDPFLYLAIQLSTFTLFIHTTFQF